MRDAWRRWSLPIVFAGGFAWAVLLAFAAPLFLGASGFDHGPVREAATVAVVALAAGGLVGGVCALWPRFLRIPEGVGPAGVLRAGLVTGAALFVAGGVLSALIALAQLRLQRGDPHRPSAASRSWPSGSSWSPSSSSPSSPTR